MNELNHCGLKKEAVYLSIKTAVASSSWQPTRTVFAKFSIPNSNIQKLQPVR